MLVRFIHHSCFLIEVDDCVLIFDYFDGNHVNGYHFEGKLPDYEADTKIYMFASHSHQDHYDMDILRFIERYPNLKYILSKDIRISPNFLKKHGINPEVRKKVLFTSPGNNYELDTLKIVTYRSTDAGVAYLVKINGVTIYHAGDLNDWRYEGAGDLVNNVVRSNFRAQISKIAKENVNIAFLPLDPRLEEHMADGFLYFMEHVDCEIVFPMHLWQNYGAITATKKKISNRMMCDKIVMISHENQEFEIMD